MLRNDVTSSQIVHVHELSGQAAHNWVVIGARPFIRAGYNSLLPSLDPLSCDGVTLPHKLNFVP
jgi:hypothetical protein